MTVSLKKSLNLFFSDKFNKINILIYFIIQAIPIVFVLMFYKNSKKIEDAILLLLCTSLFFIFYLGFHVLTVRKIIFKEKNYTPGIKDIFSVLNSGTKAFLGILLSYVLFMIVFFLVKVVIVVLMALTQSNNAISYTAIVLMVIFSVAGFLRYLIPGYLYFNKTANINSFFEFGNIFNFIDKRNKAYRKYIFITICIYGLYLIPVKTIPLFHSLNPFIIMTAIFLWILVYPVGTVLNAQLINSTKD